MTIDGSVLSLGEVLIDIIVADEGRSLKTADHFVARPGGAPANVAVALAKLGVPAAFCGAVGDDPFGERLIRVLRKHNVDTSTLAVVPNESTTIAFAWKNKKGDGQFHIVRLADTRLSIQMVRRADIANRAAVIVGSVALTDNRSRDAIYRAVDLAHAAGVPVCFDINIRPLLWNSPAEALAACQPVLDKTTILKMSVDDSRYLFNLTEPGGIFSANLGADSIRLLTNGSQGAWFRSPDDKVVHVAGFKVKSKEPTGAGDAFMAGIVSRYLARKQPPDLDDVRFAAAAGAITATRFGAIESLPYLKDIERFLKRH